MKYKPLNGYTKQKIIDTIMERNTGRRSRAFSGGCAYKNSEGNRCAVGCFIPDGHKAEQSNIYVGPMLELYKDLVGIMPLDISALTALQMVHDKTTDPDDPRPALIKWVEENVED